MTSFELYTRFISAIDGAGLSLSITRSPQDADLQVIVVSHPSCDQEIEIMDGGAWAPILKEDS